jgi:5-formyltetrahydrofolate cyclo-ligase
MASAASPQIRQSSLVDAAKAEMRSQMLKHRKTLRDAEAGAAEAIRDQVLAALTVPEDAVFAGYVAIGDELDPAPTMRALSERGHRLVLPVAGNAGETMSFKEWTFGERLVRGPYSTYVPGGEESPVFPDIVIVPVVAFDATGYRLGFGGGFYDRTLAQLRLERKIATYGIAYDGQEVPEIPRGPFDVRLDGLFTPTRAFDFPSPE